MPRLERLHLPEDRAWRQGVTEAEEVVDAVVVQIEPMLGQRPQRRYLRREGESSRLLCEE